MTTLEKLALLLDSIPSDRQEAFQSDLGAIIQNHLDHGDYSLSPEQEQEDKRRHADSNPQYATKKQITAIFGKPLPS